MSFGIPWMRDYNATIAQELLRYEKLEIQVKELTGYNFECLHELFRMGFTLKAPEYELTSTQIVKIIGVNANDI